VAGVIDAKKVYLGGAYDIKKRFIEPTVMTNVTWDDKVMQEEIFGPVLPVMAYNDLADNPHSTHSCQRWLSVLGTGAPQRHVWLVPRGFTFTSRRPASSALVVSFSMKADHPASLTDLASIPLARPLMFKSSTAITPCA
jgi:hypothetical protein